MCSKLPVRRSGNPYSFYIPTFHPRKSGAAIQWTRQLSCWAELLFPGSKKVPNPRSAPGRRGHTGSHSTYQCPRPTGSKVDRKKLVRVISKYNPSGSILILHEVLEVSMKLTIIVRVILTCGMNVTRKNSFNKCKFY